MPTRTPRWTLPCPRLWVGHAVALAIVCLVFACGGGGGGGSTRRTGGPDVVPLLVAATFVGATATPQTGDKLLLLLSEDVLLVGSLLDNDDVVLSAGSLGDVTLTPSLKNPRTVEVTLGPGVTFTPGTTTLDLSLRCDAVEDTAGNAAVPSSPVIIRAGDGDDPTISNLTLSGVHSLLNGNGPAGGTLQVPTNGFTIDLDHGDASSAVDPARTIVVADIAVEVGGNTRPVGQDLSDALTLTGDATSSSLLVPSNVVLSPGPVQLTVYVVDVTGMISAPHTFDLLIRFPDDGVRPFETTVNPSQVWYLDLSRDIEWYSVDTAHPSLPVTVNGAPNGIPDIQDLFLALGLLSSSPIANVQGSMDSNEVVMSRFMSQLIQELGNLHPGVNVTFVDTPPETFPAWIDSFPYNSFGFSQICIAGSESVSGTTGTLGVALFDPNNVFQDNNCLVDYAGFQRLGVFLHTIINEGFLSSAVSTFRTTYDPFTLDRGGTPIGDMTNDGLRLTGGLADSRATEIDTAIQRIVRFTAIITAHECGHSVGLVANGAMPQGLHGNDPVNFPVFPSSAADGHIKMPDSLFPGYAENIMSPHFDFENTLDPLTRFNSLNLAYLRERVLSD